MPSLKANPLRVKSNQTEGIERKSEQNVVIESQGGARDLDIIDRIQLCPNRTRELHNNIIRRIIENLCLGTNNDAVQFKKSFADFLDGRTSHY